MVGNHRETYTDSLHFPGHFSSFSMSTGILKEPNDPLQGQTKPESGVDSARNDVDQDVFLMFNVVDENLSWYLEDNIQNCLDPAGVDPEDPDFEESNLMHGEKLDCLILK